MNNGGKGRIMVVDDESIIRMDLKEMLLEQGYTVVAEANTGELAIELASIHKPDLIVMDVKMPRMNGIKAAKVINSMYQIPILLLTAYSEANMIEEAKEAEIVGYLVKPISEKDLIPAVEIAMNQSKRLHKMLGNIKELEQKLVLRKRIEKAKGILMEVYQLTEEEAYKEMRSYCMKNRIEMILVAEHIIKERKLDKNAKIS